MRPTTVFYLVVSDLVVNGLSGKFSAPVEYDITRQTESNPTID